MECDKCGEEIFAYQKAIQDDDSNLFHEWCVKERLNEEVRE